MIRAIYIYDKQLEKMIEKPISNSTHAVTEFIVDPGITDSIFNWFKEVQKNELIKALNFNET